MAAVETGHPDLGLSAVSVEEPATSFVSVVIPAYNEEAAIGGDIEAIMETMKVSGYPFEVIVVDDGSTDATSRIAREHGVRVISHPYNKGGGAARKTGIRHARGDVIVIIDGDASYPARDIPRLLELMESHDMVIGARTCERGTLKFLRKPVKALLRLLASFVAGRRIPDLNSGMRAFRKQLALQYFNILPDGHSWVSTISLAFLTNGYSVKYVPIDYYRRKGKSTFRPIRDSASMALLICTTIMYFRPLRFFLPAGFLLLITGLARAAYDAKVLYHVKESDIVILLTAVIIIAIGLLADLIVKMNRARA